jgi:hypothetical protein
MPKHDLKKITDINFLSVKITSLISRGELCPLGKNSGPLGVKYDS